MAKKKKNTPATPSREKFIAAVINSRTPIVHRLDISDWRRAKQAALRVDAPRFSQLQELFDYIMDDAHLSSQVQLRKSKALRSEFALVNKNGISDDKATETLRNLPVTRRLFNAIIDAQFYGYSLVELDPHPLSLNDPLGLSVIDRRHIDPRNGFVLIDSSDTTGIPYRELPEFGTYILEFRGEGLGLLDKAVPHVLFKRFAQSCWSEFCEVCGMPPRVIKTNTQDPNLRDQYLDMLSNYGSGANGVIDIDDEMLFVATNASNGEAYENLIRLCSNEISLLVNGAILGQDTQHGSYSKEQSSADIKNEIVAADMVSIEVAMNAAVLPALSNLSIIPPDLVFRFRPLRGSDQLFSQTIQAAQYFDIDTSWFKDTFGIEVLGPRSIGTLGSPSDSSDKEDADKGKKKPDQDNENDEDEGTASGSSDSEAENKPTDKKKTRQNAYNPAFDPFVVASAEDARFLGRAEERSDPFYPFV